ncbi:Coronatine-insensitive protein 1 [Capsicum annuum]|uniref:Coronatine-insensitive protein 1 n=2 Tax=Capsicum annuum TaxID=4072 RepID=A0A1U8GQ56_CAPAN|nr:coronatine-insensitive protein 1 [Capsicum annuum]AFM82491.1 coronatine insensitive 1 [Capsicum annuum var. annuum]KAF3637459.1 Coronatine-insensitive protein 1 [Capsicum annuum]KAF3656810.1 Coronatine-insensitive protein 1 [Capsicum annuum]PHT61780.1 Coronatine-insensitive protein 1 [Capsicum annuum]
MDDRSSTRLSTSTNDTVWECVIPYIQESRDRDAVSLVCKRWWQIDSITRKHITMALCYTAKPEQLSRRFPHLESVKLKGKPRAAMFNLIPEDWGGYVTPWVVEITKSFSRLKALHFRRMIVGDSDLELLAIRRGKVLQVLKLDKCSGFSTDGLLHIARSCRNLRTLLMEESSIIEKDGEWVQELALNNTVLENLNFYMTDLVQVRAEDLELIARNCKSLVSMKISEFEITKLLGFFRAAAALEEFGGGAFNDQPEHVAENGYNEQAGKYAAVVFPPRLCQLGLTYLGKNEMSILFPITFRVKKLDLLYALLDTAAHCFLLQRCPNLEILETRNVVGDRGLEVLGQYCKRLKRLRIERGADDQEMEDEEGAVTHSGLIDLAKGCLELEYMAVYVSDITNEALEIIGRYLKNLSDFRLVLLDREERITDLPLDNGVRALLRGCHNLRRFALYVRPGGLTDVGLSYVGQYSPNVRWMLLGYVGESDHGLLEFSKGCPSLQKLEVRGCCFSERALALAALQLKSLRYLWVQGYRASSAGRDLLAMARPFWNIELIPARRVVTNDGNNGEAVVSEHPAHILAYYSLAGQRTDFPDTVRPLDPTYLLAE